MRICLFGGAFDPPHVGHQQVARELISRSVCDEVWFVPVKQHPFGKKVEVNGHRVEMLKLVLEQSWKIDLFEVERDITSYSYQTLKMMKTLNPQHNFSWVIGSDNLEKFHMWNDYEKILRDFTVYVYPRVGFPFLPYYQGMILLRDFPLVRVSSTEIRTKIKRGEDIKELVDVKIAKYIREHQLYKI